MSTSPVTEGADLARFRNYLLLLAESHMARPIREKIEPVDIVQDTLGDACRNVEQIQGRPDEEVLAWLRVILKRRISDAVRALGRGKRDTTRERSLEADLEQSSQNLKAWLAAEQSSPSIRAQRREDELSLSDALATLPESQRVALMLRHCHGYTFAQIGEHLGCAPATVAGFLKRGSRQLRDLLHGLE